VIANPAANPAFATPAGQQPIAATAANAHHMLIAVALELAFVVVATMLAGISQGWGSSMLALMIALLILRGLFQVNIFGQFVQNNPLAPPANQTSNAPVTGGIAV
jgi:hypothetical protein